MTSISIRERALKDGKSRLVLNYYLPGGKRKTEKLDLTVVDKPTTREGRESNKTARHLADKIRSKRFWKSVTKNMDLLIFKNHKIVFWIILKMR